VAEKDESHAILDRAIALIGEKDLGMAMMQDEIRALRKQVQELNQKLLALTAAREREQKAVNPKHKKIG
jgi:hypothetical protein